MGAVAIQNAVERSKLDKSQVQEVFMGCVVQAGVGQAPARQAALFAGSKVSTKIAQSFGRIVYVEALKAKIYSARHFYGHSVHNFALLVKQVGYPWLSSLYKFCIARGS